MEDIFESNGYLPLQYVIDSENRISDPDHYKRDSSIGNIRVTLRFYKSFRYQTDHLIYVGIWKPASSVHV